MANTALPDLRAVAQARLCNQRLVDRGFGTPAAAVRWFGAVQAQDYGGAKWAVGQRVHDAVDADVESAFREGLTPPQKQALLAAARRLDAFLGQPVRLRNGARS